MGYNYPELLEISPNSLVTLLVYRPARVGILVIKEILYFCIGHTIAQGLFFLPETTLPETPSLVLVLYIIILTRVVFFVLVNLFPWF